MSLNMGSPRLRSGMVPTLLIMIATFFPLALQAEIPAQAVAECITSPCLGWEGDSILFRGSDSTGDQPLGYTWDFGDGTSTTTQANPEHIFIHPHNPTVNPDGWPVTLTVRDAYSETDSDTLYVEIQNELPEAVVYGLDIANEPQYFEMSVFINTYYTFNAEESSDRSGGIDYYDWCWDWDGIEANFDACPGVQIQAAPFQDHRWTEYGTKIVGLRVKDDDSPRGVTYTSLIVNVIPNGPWARITGPGEDFNEGAQALFLDNTLPSASPIVDRQWDMDYDGQEFVADPAYDGQTSVSHAFNDAREYIVALLVTDDQDRTSLGTLAVTPLNVLPEAALIVRAAGDNSILDAPYEIEEGKPLRFDASGSSATPGSIAGYEWDWTYDGSFNSLPSDSGYAIRDHAWPDDGEFVVRVRVVDDDSTVGEPSDDFTEVSVTVTDIAPLAEIDGPSELQEGDTGVFRVEDVGGNTDDIVYVEWDFDYGGEPEFFDADEQDVDLLLVTHQWDEITTANVAVRITDAETMTSIASIGVVIIDKPPTAIITPAGLEGVVHVDEGEEVIFSAENSEIAPGGRLTRVSWDDNYLSPTFAPDYENYVSTCDAGVCSFVSFAECGIADDCPSGLGALPAIFDEGPNDDPIFMALCVEDEDGASQCVEGDTAFSVVEVVVDNVAPSWTASAGPTEVFERANYIFNARQIVNEPSEQDAENLLFNCVKTPPGMTCNENSGLLEWYPGQQDVDCGGSPAAEHQVVMTVQDDDGGISGVLDYHILVKNINDPPEITSCAQEATTDAEEFYFTEIDVYDPDRRCAFELLTFYLEDAVSGMQISGGRFEWTPTTNDIGDHTVKLCVRDAAGLSDCCEHTIHVAPPNVVAKCSFGGDGGVPVISALPGKNCLVANITQNPGSQQLAYHWQQSSGPVDVFMGDKTTDPELPKSCFATTDSGTYRFELTLENDWGEGPACLVDVEIANVQPGAILPGDRNYLPGSVVEIAAAGSGDYNANDTELSYSWTDYKDVLDDTTAALVSFIPFNIGIYTFDLVVDDGEMSSELTSMAVEVLDPENETAIPYAAILPLSPQVVGTEFVLDGSASVNRFSREDLEYVWSYIEGPLDGNQFDWGSYDGEEHLLRATTDTPGLYRFALKVSNGDYESRSAVRSVLVGDLTNEPPTVNAGLDDVASLAVVSQAPRTVYTQIYLHATGDDPEQMPLSYAWRQTGGVPVALVGNLTNAPSFVAFKPGLYRFEVTADDGALTSLPDEVVVAVAAVGSVAPSVVVADMDPFTGSLTVDPYETITLDASGSTPSDRDLSFEWSQLSGPPVALSTWTDSVVSFTPDVFGQTYVFRLVVWDVQSGSPSLPLDLKVEVLAQDNSTPVCDVENDDLTAVVGDVVDLDADGTYDPDEGQELEYEWTQILDDSVAEVAIHDADKIAAWVQPLTTGEYVFRFRAFDGFESCYHQVTLKAGANTTPVAIAGQDQEVCVNTSVQLDGSSSFDDDGHPIFYTWRVDENNNTIGLADSDLEPSNEAVKPTFTAFDTGEVTFKLTVSDTFEGGTSQPSEVTIIVTTCSDTDGDSPATDGDDTIDCIDNDNDFYGVGTDCLGPDCDDNDPNVTGACPDEDEGGGGCAHAPAGPFGLLGILLFLVAAVRRRRFD